MDKNKKKVVITDDNIESIIDKKIESLRFSVHLTKEEENYYREEMRKSLLEAKKRGVLYVDEN